MSIVPDKSRIPMGRETPINSDTVKPTGTMRGTPSKAVDTALGYLWQDYSERPHEWRHSARSYMSAILRHNNILNNVTIDYLLERTWLMVEENEWLGNRRMLMRCFGTVCRNYEHEKQVAKQAKREQTPLVEKLNWERKVKHPDLFNPDGSQRGYYENGTVPDTTGIATSVEDFVARQRTAPPVVPEPSEDKLDDDGKAEFAASFLTREQRKEQETTMGDNTLDAATNYEEADVREGELHFSQLDGFYKKVEKLFQKRKQSAVLGRDKYMPKAHELMGVKSFTEIKLSEDNFFDLLDDRLKVFCEVNQQTPDKPKSDEKPNNAQKADNLHESAPVGPDRPTSQGTGLPANVASSEPAIEATVIEEPIQNTDDRIADIRSQPQKQSIAIVQPQNSLAGVPIIAQWDIMRQQADILVKSGFLPASVKTAEQAIAIMMMGQALNIEPIVALNTINVISGKPTVSPQLMLALVRRSGQLEYMKITDDGETCTVRGKRRGEPEHVSTFSMDDAKRMKTTEYVNGNKTTISLSEKYNWKAQPTVMRQWRAISAFCRVVFSDITWGIASYTTEEMDPDIIVDYAA